MEFGGQAPCTFSPYVDPDNTLTHSLCGPLNFFLIQSNNNLVSFNYIIDFQIWILRHSPLHYWPVRKLKISLSRFIVCIVLLLSLFDDHSILSAQVHDDAVSLALVCFFSRQYALDLVAGGRANDWRIYFF